MMTHRERFFAALNGEPTDRVPVWLLFPYHPLSCYVDVRSHPKYRPIHELSLRYAITLNRRTFNVPLHPPEVKQYTDESAGVGNTRTFLDYRGSRIHTETRAGKPVKKLVARAEDLEFFCSLPIETDPRRITAALDRQLPQYLKEKEEFPEELGAMMLSLGEPISVLYNLSNLEEYAVWSVTHQDLIAGWLDRLAERYRIVYRYCLERDLADVYFLVGSELASPPLVGRRTFQRWVVPHAADLIDLIHSFGKKVIAHHHGPVKEVLPDIVETGPDGLHTIEAPPVGDCTLTEAYGVCGDRITLIGNIQYDEFRSRTPAEMAELVRNVIDECWGKRFILSPTAGPYDGNVSDRVIENYRVLLETAWEYGSKV
jgi:uroporphyrinogen-III decarboxylase